MDLDYKKIKVTGVKRLENLNLYEKYSSFRQHMFGKVLSQPGVLCFPSAENLPNSKGQLLTTSVIDQCLTKEIYQEVNEHYVFHGTKQENIEIILATGLDSRMAGTNAPCEKYSSFQVFSTSDLIACKVFGSTSCSLKGGFDANIGSTFNFLTL
jgi:hypothetical protein